MKTQTIRKNNNAMAVSASRRSSMLFAALALMTFALSAQATNLVANGGFENTTNGACGLQYCTTAPPWQSTGYAFLFAPGTADTTGSDVYPGSLPLELWGPGNGSANGLPATSPAGGNYLAADGAFAVSPIEQTINNLTVGGKYTVGFWWAGAQQYPFTGATTEQWQVSLGSQTQMTAVSPNASHGFTGWMYQSFTFTADNSSDVLSFVAAGTPNGVPPFVLLDGVTMNAATPEPGTLALSVGGLLGIVATLRSKRWFKR